MGYPPWGPKESEMTEQLNNNQQQTFGEESVGSWSICTLQSSGKKFTSQVGWGGKCMPSGKGREGEEGRGREGDGRGKSRSQAAGSWAGAGSGLLPGLKRFTHFQ